jgi:hypothetical protein
VNKIITLVFLILTSISCFGQTDAKYKKAKIAKTEKKGIIYYHEKSYGIGLRTNGMQLIYNKTTVIHATKKRFWEAGYSSIKHEKERKNIPFYASDFGVKRRKYVLGKINTVMVFYYRYGFEKKISSKTYEHGVDISFHYAAGPLLAIAKSYTLNLVNKNNDGNLVIYNTNYYKSTDSLFLNPYYIYGYGGFFKGFQRIQPNAGLSTKIGITIDWAKNEEKLAAVDIGLQLDAYLYKLPILTNYNNHQFWPSLYLNCRIGNKK